MSVADSTKSSVNGIVATVGRWLLPALGGAIFMVLLDWGSQTTKIQVLEREVTTLRADVQNIRATYATNTRVDDLQSEMRTGFTTMGTKLDNLTTLIIDRLRAR